MTSHFCAAQFLFCHKKVRIKASLCFWDMSKFIRLEAQTQSLHDTGTFRLDKKKGMWRGLYCCLVFLKCLTALPFLMLSTVCYTHQNCVNTPKFFEQLYIGGCCRLPRTFSRERGLLMRSSFFVVNK